MRLRREAALGHKVNRVYEREGSLGYQWLMKFRLGKRKMLRFPVCRQVQSALLLFDPESAKGIYLQYAPYQ